MLIDAKEKFHQTQHIITLLFRDVEPYSFNGTKAEGCQGNLYLIDKETDRTLMSLRKELENACIDEAELKKYAFTKICKHFNPGEPVNDFVVYGQFKREHVADPDKVRGRLEAKLALKENVYNAETKQMIADSNYTDEEQRRFEEQRREALKEILENGRKELDYIDANWDKLDVRIVGKGDVYGSIGFEAEGKRVTEHISTRLPNALYYIPADKSHRADAELYNFLNDATQVLDDIYYATLTPERRERRKRAKLKEIQKKRKGT